MGGFWVICLWSSVCARSFKGQRRTDLSYLGAALWDTWHLMIWKWSFREVKEEQACFGRDSSCVWWFPWMLHGWEAPHSHSRGMSEACGLPNWDTALSGQCQPFTLCFGLGVRSWSCFIMRWWFVKRKILHALKRCGYNIYVCKGLPDGNSNKLQAIWHKWSSILGFKDMQCSAFLAQSKATTQYVIECHEYRESWAWLKTPTKLEGIYCISLPTGNFLKLIYGGISCLPTFMIHLLQAW